MSLRRSAPRTGSDAVVSGASRTLPTRERNPKPLPSFCLQSTHRRSPIVIDKQYDRRVMMFQRDVDVSERLPKLLILFGSVFATFLLVLISAD